MKNFKCALCNQPVLPEVCMIVKEFLPDGSILETPFHWECVMYQAQSRDDENDYRNN
jgi:hypothetical protein